MFSAGQVPSGRQRIIIHHLSDLHYEQGTENPLVPYSRFLQRLEDDQRPDLVVITGDLTATGVKRDLNTVAALLRQQFPSWTDPASHIYVVPGPRDINWEGNDPPGLNAFYDSFKGFGLPSSRHEIPQHGVAAMGSVRCIAYPVDTCYAPEDLDAGMTGEFHAYGRVYQDFLKDYRQTRRGMPGWFGRGKGDRQPERDKLRERYLNMTEANELTLLDTGRVDRRDLSAFDSWIASQAVGQSESLKILVTHHPLVVQPELRPAPKGSRRKETAIEQLATSARKAGFHLALHGHIHKPQVLSDLSLLLGTDVRHPMRQIGAGSLGDTGTFNEITATYRNEGEPHRWRLEIRTISLKAENPHEATSFVLLNRTEDAAKQAEKLEEEKQRRLDFESRVRVALRQFSEAVYRAQTEDSQGNAAPVVLPQGPMQSVETIIREVVFPGFALRARLYLEDQRRPGNVPRLTATYLAPADSTGPTPVTYPDSLAALSLVLGRTLIYPAALQETLKEDDYGWLARSGKDQNLDKILQDLTRNAAREDALRYEHLRDRLNKGMSDPLPMKAFYREVPERTPPTYPSFICLPFPQRALEGMLPEKLEVAVLVVSVRAPERDTEARAQRGAAAPDAQEIFTPERTGMLETLAELTGQILLSSSALHKPKGVWDGRLWT
jgi:3',5'-cyclic AMP phosphodiesterase CpdA